MYSAEYCDKFNNIKMKLILHPFKNMMNFLHKVKLQSVGVIFIPHCLLVEPIGLLRAVDLPLISSLFLNLEVGVLLPVNAG
ncbi:hypothetical protein [Psychrobacillus lasiicapitis]|uniref:hypothetical protein n=1 Tax=Psychrobacillus lasiicapitis TaxID=1636719 RepID=UPI001B88275E|nr:hypothetical protein [Psychrobacillus lasiicapitis]